MKELTGKVAVVTGAGRGIGRAIALRLAAEGARVACLARTGSAGRVAEEISRLEGGEGRGYEVDVTDGEAMASVGKQVLEDFGRVDILVNNAGVTDDTLMLRMAEESWDKVLDTNLKGAFLAVKAFQRPLLKAGGARIINISSIIGLIGNAGQANYAASKAGLIGMSKSLAREFAGKNVTVNSIAPGFIVTDMTDGLNEGIKDAILEKIPLKRFGEAEDIAAAVAFLAGSGGKYITGQTLVVDGGMTM